MHHPRIDAGFEPAGVQLGLDETTDALAQIDQSARISRFKPLKHESSQRSLVPRIRAAPCFSKNGYEIFTFVKNAARPLFTEITLR